MSNNETITKYLSDMYALEEHIAQPLKSQAIDKDFAPYPEAQALVQRILSSTESALVRLDAVTKALGGEARSGMKSTITAVAGVAAAVINEGRTHPITKKLRDDYTALSLTAIGYELLHVTANALGSTEVAALAQARLHEVAGYIMELSQSIVPVAVKELAETNAVDPLTVPLSQKNIKAAWTP